MGEVERIGVKIESVYKIERIKTQTEIRPRDDMHGVQMLRLWISGMT